MSEKTLVVQHNKLVEARYKLTLEEQRLIKILVSHIQPNDDDFKAYEIYILDLTNLLGITDDYYYNKIKTLTKKLRDSSLCFTNENGDEIITGWLSSAIYRKGKGVVELRFDPVLKPYLLQLKSLFTSYELGNILRLRGIYSIRIYELLKQYEKLGKREFSLDDFKKILRIETEYKQYRDLKKSVLSPATIEICEKTDISFSIEEKKRGRKVIGLIFYITSKKRQLTEPLTVIDQPKETPTQQPYQEPPKQDLPKPPPQNQPDARKQKQIEILFDMGVAPFAVEKLLASFDADRIAQGITYTREKQKDGTVKDVAAFVITAIERGFVDPQAQEKAKESEALRLRQERAKAYEEVRQRWEMVKKQYNNWNNQVFDNFMQNITTDELESQKQQFMQSSVYTSFGRHIELDKGIGKNFFLGHIRGQLGLDIFEVWAQKNGVDISVFPIEMLNEMKKPISPTSP